MCLIQVDFSVKTSKGKEERLNLSLQIHIENFDQEISNSFATKRRQAVRYTRLNLAVFSPETSDNKTLKFRDQVRRRSCYCSCCGGSSKLDMKTWYLPQIMKRRKDGLNISDRDDEDEIGRKTNTQIMDGSSASSLKSKQNKLAEALSF